MKIKNILNLFFINFTECLMALTSRLQSYDLFKPDICRTLIRSSHI